MNTVSVEFHDLESSVYRDEPLTFVVIQAKHKDQWLFVRHKDRTTYEIPGGHIELMETPDEAAYRELKEETGALDFRLKALCDYSVTTQGKSSFGRLYFADVITLGPLPDYEIGLVIQQKDLPEMLTYPLIQPLLFDYVIKAITYTNQRPIINNDS